MAHKTWENIHLEKGVMFNGASAHCMYVKYVGVYRVRLVKCSIRDYQHRTRIFYDGQIESVKTNNILYKISDMKKFETTKKHLLLVLELLISSDSFSEFQKRLSESGITKEVKT